MSSCSATWCESSKHNSRLRKENDLLRRRQATGEKDLPAKKRACGARTGSVGTSGDDTVMLQVEDGAALAMRVSSVELHQWPGIRYVIDSDGSCQQ
jgi:hypothetical protein